MTDGFALNIIASQAAEVAPHCVRLALDHGLGIYDPQAGLTYNPSRVVASSDAMLESPWVLFSIPAQQPLLRELVAVLGRKKSDPFCILERPDSSFMQTLARPEGDFVLEHRLAQGKHSHLPRGTDAKTVIQALEGFALRTDTWLTLPWEELSL